MRDLTLFKAYLRVSAKMQNIVHQRGYLHGIMVADDPYARSYQQHSRLHHRLEVRLRRRMGDPSTSGKQCWYCGYPLSMCLRDCKRKVRKTREKNNWS